MSLLDKAKKYKTISHKKSPLTDEDVELAIAWLQGDISFTQVVAAYDLKQGSASVYSKLASALRKGYQDGTLSLASRVE